jgi:endogenous inhibitor of DNA gyrase (YacG/DUF329 family)
MSTARPAGPICPICKKPVKPRAENAAFPFCSPRCKQIDLGRWLDESYRLPAEEPGSSDEGKAPEDEDS